LSDLTVRLYEASKNSAAENDAWGAICAAVYADIMTLDEVMSGAPKDAALDGSVVSTTPKPEDDSAQALVEAVRFIVVQGVGEEYRGELTQRFISLDHLSGLEAPSDTEQLGVIAMDRTEGFKAHAFKAVKSSDSRIHARAAAALSQAGADKQEVRNAVRASDIGVFEVKSIEYALSHADWQLDGHAVRLAMALTAIDALGPNGSRKAVREVLTRQFDGLDYASELEWVIQ
jgi:hypothetical protein